MDPKQFKLEGGPTRPTLEELMAPDEDRKPEYHMRLDLPRQVIEEEEPPVRRKRDSDRNPENNQPKALRTQIVLDEVYFEIKFPSVAEIGEAQKREKKDG